MADTSLVLLGFVDQPIKDQTNIYWATNKIGGEAIFPESIEDHQLSTLANNQLICPNCLKLCSSICQIGCAIDDSPVSRVIYVFACLESGCNYFSVLRFIHHQQSQPNSSQLKVSSQQSNQRQIWEIDSSNWSDDENDEKNSNFLRKDDEGHEEVEPLDFQKGKFLPKSFARETNHGFQPYYIYVENLEDLKSSKSFVTKKEEKYNIDDGDDFAASNEEGEKYENPEVATIFANDQISYKFYKNLRAWPGQIIRYSWQGRPLFNKSIGNPRIDDCPNCGSDRSFEFQLMPGIISQLRPSTAKFSSIDFGTILIYCCSNNCDNQTFNEEKCFILEDLDNNVINGFVSSRD